MGLNPSEDTMSEHECSTPRTSHPNDDRTRPTMNEYAVHDQQIRGRMHGMFMH